MFPQSLIDQLNGESNIAIKASAEINKLNLELKLSRDKTLDYQNKFHNSEALIIDRDKQIDTLNKQLSDLNKILLDNVSTKLESSRSGTVQTDANNRRFISFTR